MRPARPASASRQRRTPGNGEHLASSAREKTKESADAPSTANIRKEGSPQRSSPPASPKLSPGRRTIRPRSAQPQRTSARPPSRVWESPLDAGRRCHFLQQECTELKLAANTTSKDTMRMRTRYMVLERELQKRERQLRSLITLSQNGGGLSMDLIERLREERNMLPLFQRKIKDLHGQIEERDVEIKRIKRDPQFTRIIELQVEYASWQHETRRLESLLQEPHSGAATSKREVEVHSQRVAKLEAELAEVERKRDSLAEDLGSMVDDHSSSKSLYTEKQVTLSRQQDETRDLAIEFKQLLQERKKAETIEDEVAQMEITKTRHVSELRSLSQSLQTAAELAKKRDQLSAEPVASPAEPRSTIREAVLQSDLSPVPAGFLSNHLWWFRRSAANCGENGSLFARLNAADKDNDGVISRPELLAAMEDWGSCPVPPEQAVSALLAILPSRSELESSIHWLEVLVALERLGSATSSSSKAAPPKVSLPEIRPLRAATLRSGRSSEELKGQLSAASTLVHVQDLFGGLGLTSAVAAKWVEAWQCGSGPDGLLLQLPLSEAAMTANSLAAWRARCVGAVRAHKKELVEAFSVWRSDMVLTEDQFRMVCMDVMGAKLSEEDVDDFGLLAGAGNPAHGGNLTVSGSEVLKLLEL